MQKLGDYLTTTMSTLIIDQQRIKLSQKNGNVIAQVECHNKERNCLTGDLEFQGVCCYFTLTDSKGTRLRDHYCFNADLNKLEYMFSDEFVVPQPKKPAVTFTLRDVEYGLHTNGEYVEISQNGASIARLPCTDREYSVFSGKTHVYKDCFYFLLGDGKWKKLALFNPQSHFTLGTGAIFNPHFKDGFLISIILGDRDTRFEDVIYRYALLQGQCLLQKEEHYITDAQGFRCKTVVLTEWDKQPF